MYRKEERVKKRGQHPTDFLAGFKLWPIRVTMNRNRFAPYNTKAVACLEQYVDKLLLT
jgi:hypothetical protein